MGTRDARAPSRRSWQGRHAGALPAARPGLRHLRRQHRIRDDAHRPDAAAHRDAEPRSQATGRFWMDGRALETNPNPSWMGYSVGRAEGDTLVVESNGFHPGTWLDSDGHRPHRASCASPSAIAAPASGRWKSRSPSPIPGAYTRPWTVKVASEYAADTEMLEWVCNEGAGRSLVHWVGMASDERQERGARCRRRILARYVGHLRRAAAVLAERADRRRAQCRQAARCVITVEDGRLVGDMDGRGKQVLIATSDTEFSRALRPRRPVHRRRRAGCS